MQNKVQLITYVDRLTGGGLKELNELLNGDLKGLFGGIHVLPFFYPIDGVDAGFDPIDHRKVDARLGSWDDIKILSGDLDVMADLIVNHISSESPEFTDYLEHGSQSAYAPMILTKDHVFTNGDSHDITKIYRPRPGSPFTEFLTKSGETALVWTTFSPGQIDINIDHELGRKYILDILDIYHEHGVAAIRLDAVGYAVKKAGTSCFMIDETHEFIKELTREANSRDITVLVEIHSYFRNQIKIAELTNYVYDFALPPLVLHALYNGTVRYLDEWLTMSPRNAITVLDTHDGIGIIDVGMNPDNPSEKGLLSNDEIDSLVDEIHKRTNGESFMATGENANNWDLYQVNCTYFDALGKDENLYLMARAIQFFCPGIPQVYYMGYLCQLNDIELLKETGTGRAINRTKFDDLKLKEALQRPIVGKLNRLIEFRNSLDAFNGDFTREKISDSSMRFSWRGADSWATLEINLDQSSFEINSSDGILSFS